MPPKTATTIVTYCLLGLAGVVSTTLPRSLSVSESWAQGVPPDVMRLAGVIRDFTPDHPDFAVTDLSDMGLYTGTVAPVLGPDGQPVFAGNGQEVTSPWYDKDGNPIAPYAGPGLPFGHFDVDVYDGPSATELYHQHEFDDKYDVTYIDVANDTKLLFADIIGGGYPNDLNLQFVNVHNGGGGTYTFEAGGGEQTGTTADGFATTFTPALLTQLRVNFVALAAMRATQPDDSQIDVVDRDDALTIRMYDAISDALVYEIVVYYHDKGALPLPPLVDSGVDACGVSIDDTLGAFGSLGNGAITDTGSFDQWFRDDLGTNLSAVHTLLLQRNAEGVYEYLTDSFFPIDEQLLGNGADSHNNFFTYAISASFTYSACTDQFFEFESNNDAWVFIDSKLALDLGGTGMPAKQYVAMDRLDLVDGEVYTLKFFYAHRRDALFSLFRMRTNLVLATNGLPTVSASFD